MRSFIAVEVKDKDLIQRFVELQSVLSSSGSDLKFVETQNLHFTLKFLGEISNSDEKIISEKLDELEFDSIQIRYNGLGVFPNQSRVSVVWVGLDQESGERLKKLAVAVREKLGGLKLGDERPFQPHLTIARVKSGLNRTRLVEIVNSMKDQNLGFDELKIVKLKKSTLTPNGPIYEDIHTVTLRGSLP